MTQWEIDNPFLYEQLRQIANREHPVVKSLQIGMTEIYIRKHNGHVTKKVIAERNDPCPCGSGKKVKKCCGRSV